MSEIGCLIFNDQGNSDLYPIPFDNEWLSIKKSENFFHIIQYKQKSIELLQIGIVHSLKPQDKTWFDTGLAIGIITLLINPIYGMVGNNSYLPLIISINTIAITYLIVTKGWIFTKDLEKVVRLCQNTAIKLDYPKFYLYLIIILFIEIVGVLMYSLLSPIMGILPTIVISIQMSFTSIS